MEEGEITMNKVYLVTYSSNKNSMEHTDSLEHYGVKGMKWGKHKAQARIDTISGGVGSGNTDTAQSIATASNMVSKAKSDLDYQEKEVEAAQRVLDAYTNDVKKLKQSTLNAIRAAQKAKGTDEYNFRKKLADQAKSRYNWTLKEQSSAKNRLANAVHKRSEAQRKLGYAQSQQNVVRNLGDFTVFSAGSQAQRKKKAQLAKNK